MIKDFRDGVVTISHSPRLGAMVTLFGVVMFGQGILNVAFVAFAAHLGGAAAFGTLIGSQGAGAVIGAATAAAAIKLIGPERAATSGMVATGTVLLSFLVLPNLASAVAAMVLIGVAVVISTVGATTIIQTATPTNTLGRVFGALAAITATATLLGLGAASTLGRLISDRSMIAAAGGVVATAGLLSRLLMTRQPTRPAAITDETGRPAAKCAE